MIANLFGDHVATLEQDHAAVAGTENSLSKLEFIFSFALHLLFSGRLKFCLRKLTALFLYIDKYRLCKITGHVVSNFGERQL